VVDEVKDAVAHQGGDYEPGISYEAENGEQENPKAKVISIQRVQWVDRVGDRRSWAILTQNFL
jgi:hypothetical protein